MKRPNRAQLRKQARSASSKAARCALEERAFQAGYQEGYRVGHAAATRIDVVDENHVFLDKPGSLYRKVMFTPRAAMQAAMYSPEGILGPIAQATVTLRLERKAIEIDGYVIEWADWKVDRVDRSGYDPRSYR